MAQGAAAMVGFPQRRGALLLGCAVAFAAAGLFIRNIDEFAGIRIQGCGLTRASCAVSGSGA